MRPRRQETKTCLSIIFLLMWSCPSELFIPTIVSLDVNSSLIVVVTHFLNVVSYHRVAKDIDNFN